MSENFSELADSMLDSVKAFVASEIQKARQTLLEEMQQRIEMVPAGPAGKDGAPGERGQDGPVGERGERGEPGQDGTPGRDGAAGVQGTEGIPGQKGETGTRGMPGQDGRDGRDGMDGIPGKDALQLDLLECIDNTRSYRRGTWAAHDGGLVVSVRTTDPLANKDLEQAGWMVAVHGLAELGFEQVDPREALWIARRTNEKRGQKEVRLPGFLHRGKFNPQKEYVRGDNVMYDNSSWVCVVDKTSSPPIISQDWALSACKGGKGKDGAPGTPGEPGQNGVPGKDYSRIGFTGGPT